MSLKSSWQGLQFCFRLHFNRRFAHKIMGPQNHRSPNFGSPGTKCHLDVGTTRNLAFCNYLMQLISSCMWHMQLEIRPVANDKLHEICSCMWQSYNTSTYGWVIRFHPPILYTSSWSCDCMQLQGLRSHYITC
jgi:hypothetical protein